MQGTNESSAQYEGEPKRDFSDSEIRELLAFIIEEAESFGQQKVTLDFGGACACYSFSTQDGKSASGSLHESIRIPLKNFLLGHNSLAFSVFLPELKVNRQVTAILTESSSNATLDWSPKVIEAPIPPEVSEKIPATSKARKTSSKRKNTVVRLKTVLIVEDNSAFAHVLERFLKRQQIVCVFAQNGKEALERILNVELAPDLVICDVHMPEMDGFEFLQKVRNVAKHKDLPLVMLTSDGDVEVEIRLLTEGADAFVEKSDDPRILCAHVQRLLSKKGASKEGL